MTITLPQASLHRFAADIFTGAGIKDDMACQWADVLVWANLRGVDSHGVMRIPRYVDLIKSGAINSSPKMTLEKEAGAIAVLNADRAPGGPAMIRAMDEAIKRAKDVNIGWCAAKNITHAGAVGYFALKAAEADMAGIVMSASGRPLMAYHGARVSGVSTNPISIAIPSLSRAPLLLDMSTSNVSFGKLMNARKLGNEIGANWGISTDGGETTDPHEVETLRPLGGPKGSGLSLMIECLSSLAIGNPLIANWFSETTDKSKPVLNGIAIAVNLSAFGEKEQLEKDIDDLANAMKSLPKAQGVDEIYLPGERGNVVKAKREDSGIPLPDAIWKQLLETAESLSVEQIPETI